MTVLQPGLGTRGHLVADPRRNLPEMIGAAGRSAGANRGLPVPPTQPLPVSVKRLLR